MPVGKREQIASVCVHQAQTGSGAMAARKKVAKKKSVRKAAKRELIYTGSRK